MSDSKFPITEAQLVGMFMECVAYGAPGLAFLLQSVADRKLPRHVPCDVRLVYEGIVVSERKPSSEAVQRDEMGDASGGTAHVHVRNI